MKNSMANSRAITILLLLAAASSWADIVQLKNGGEFEGEIREVGDNIEIKTKRGATLKIKRSDIKKIIRKKLPAEEFKERKASLDTGDPKATFTLANWCRQNRMKEEYEYYLKLTLRLDPKHPTARESLYKYQKTYKAISINREAVEKLKREFGKSFQIRHTRHFRICYNTEPVFYNNRADLFEAVYRSFYGFFEKREFSLTTLNDHLEVILFDTRAQFNTYARKRSPVLESSAGFYSPSENRVAFYNALNDTRYRRMRQQIVSSEKQIQELRKTVNKMKGKITFTFPDGSRKSYSKSGANGFLAKEKRKVADQRRNLASIYRNENISTTVHECLHQLAFNLGVQKITGDNPKWLGEGLATYFETASYGAISQIGKVNSARLKYYQAARKANALIPLSALVSDDRYYIVSSRTAGVAYAQGWGLVHFLIAKYPGEFMAYLKMLGSKRLTQMPPPQTRLGEFVKSFDKDPAALQREWHSYMNSLR